MALDLGALSVRIEAQVGDTVNRLSQVSDKIESIGESARGAEQNLSNLDGIDFADAIDQIKELAQETHNISGVDVDVDVSGDALETLEEIDDFDIEDKEFAITDNDTGETLIASTAELDAEEIDDKAYDVDDSGTTADLVSETAELDDTDIADKEFETDDSGTTSDLLDDIDTLDGESIGDKSFATTDDGTTAAAQAEVDALGSTTINDIIATVAANTGTAVTNIAKVGDTKIKDIIAKVTADTSGITKALTGLDLSGFGASFASKISSVLGGAGVAVAATAAGAKLVDWFTGGALSADMENTFETFKTNFINAMTPDEVKVAQMAQKFASTFVDNVNKSVEGQLDFNIGNAGTYDSYSTNANRWNWDVARVQQFESFWDDFFDISSQELQRAALTLSDLWNDKEKAAALKSLGISSSSSEYDQMRLLIEAISEKYDNPTDRMTALRDLGFNDRTASALLQWTNTSQEQIEFWDDILNRGGVYRTEEEIGQISELQNYADAADALEQAGKELEQLYTIEEQTAAAQANQEAKIAENQLIDALTQYGKDSDEYKQAHEKYLEAAQTAAKAQAEYEAKQAELQSILTLDTQAMEALAKAEIELERAKAEAQANPTSYTKKQQAEAQAAYDAALAYNKAKNPSLYTDNFVASNSDMLDNLAASMISVLGDAARPFAESLKTDINLSGDIINQIGDIINAADPMNLSPWMISIDQAIAALTEIWQTNAKPDSDYSYGGNGTPFGEGYGTLNEYNGTVVNGTHNEGDGAGAGTYIAQQTNITNNYQGTSLNDGSGYDDVIH